MADHGKPSRRDEQARLTRAEVVRAAHRLFVERGYATTSIRAVAHEAGVSEQTVYRVFGAKVGLLRAVIESAVGVDDNVPSLREGPLLEQITAAPSPSERLREVGELARKAYERGLAELENVVMSAVSADARVAELARYIAQQRYEDTRSLVLAILGDAELDGVKVDDVVDYTYAVESSPVYSALAERGWTTDTYVEWFVEMFERMFLSRVVQTPPRVDGKGEGWSHRPNSTSS